MSSHHSLDVEAPLPTYEEAVEAPKYSTIFEDAPPVQPEPTARGTRTGNLSDLPEVHGAGRRGPRSYRGYRRHRSASHYEDTRFPVYYDSRVRDRRKQLWTVLWGIAVILTVMTIFLVMSVNRKQS